jgi:uncharacterized membrane protein YgcG
VHLIAGTESWYSKQGQSMRAHDGWCIALAACYFAVVLLCAVQVARIAYHGHQLRSFRVGFLALSLAWTALKGIFWLNVQGWTLLEWVMFSKLPTCGQMASYLFFLIFCAQHVHRKSWAVQGPRCWLGFALANLATLGSVVGFTVPALLEGDADGSAATAEQREETHLGLVFSAAVYAVLCVSLAMYGWLIWSRNQPAAANAAAAAAKPGGGGNRRGGAVKGGAPASSGGGGGGGGGSSPLTKISFKTGFVKKDEKVSGIVPVLIAASVVFFLRTVYDALLATGAVLPLAITDGHMQYAVPFYLLTDIFPTLCEQTSALPSPAPFTLSPVSSTPLSPPAPSRLPPPASHAGRDH